VPDPVSAITGGSAILGAVGAENAADTQAEAAAGGIAENRRQFDFVQNLFKPFIEAGGRGLASYEGLLGTAGPEAQRSAIAAIEQGPMFGRLVQQGENAILANAAATGGLRGGNTNTALAGFRGDVLAKLIDQQLGRFGQLATVGQNSAAGVGNAALGTGTNVAQLLQQQGAAEAGGILSGVGAIARGIGTIGGIKAANAPVQAAYSQTPAGSAGFGTGAAYGNQDMGQYF